MLRTIELKTGQVMGVQSINNEGTMDLFPIGEVDLVDKKIKMYINYEIQMNTLKKIGEG